MSDPTNPADPQPAEKAVTAADAGADTAELAAVPAADPAPPGQTTEAGQTAAGQTAAGQSAAAGAKDPSGKATSDGIKTTEVAAVAAKKKGWRRFKVRGPWVTVGAAFVVLILLAVGGYVWGLGPLSTLNSKRGITPPAKLAGLDRITDPDIRDRAGLDQTREALRRINNGKQVTVEAYGSLDGDRLYVIIALRGKVDIDKTVADSGATPDKIKKVGDATCVESTGNLPTQCYRGSNTLTVIAQSANEGVNVDQVEPVAEEAFKAMR